MVSILCSRKVNLKQIIKVKFWYYGATCISISVCFSSKKNYVKCVIGASQTRKVECCWKKMQQILHVNRITSCYSYFPSFLFFMYYFCIILYNYFYQLLHSIAELKIYLLLIYSNKRFDRQ